MNWEGSKYHCLSREEILLFSLAGNTETNIKQVLKKCSLAPKSWRKNAKSHTRDAFWLCISCTQPEYMPHNYWGDGIFLLNQSNGNDASNVVSYFRTENGSSWTYFHDSNSDRREKHRRDIRPLQGFMSPRLALNLLHGVDLDPQASTSGALGS